MKHFSLLIALGCVAISTSMAQPQSHRAQTFFTSQTSEEYQLYRIFRSNGRFLTCLAAASDEELYSKLKKFGKGEYSCVSTNESLIADRRIIVY